MSSLDRARKVVFSPRARQDFIDILRFTGETWGQGQLHVYRDKINDALQLVARNPAMGDRCVFRRSVTARFGIVTAEFGSVTDRFGDVTDGRLVVA